MALVNPNMVYMVTQCRVQVRDGKYRDIFENIVYFRYFHFSARQYICSQLSVLYAIIRPSVSEARQQRLTEWKRLPVTKL